MSEWYKNSGAEDDIAVSTRIRIARNLKGIPFPARMSREQLEKINSEVKKAVKSFDTLPCSELKLIDMNKVPQDEIYAMVERHIISPEFAENRADHILLLSSDEQISIMICEEDHIRIQVLHSGLALNEAYEIADIIDNMFSEKLKIAYDEKLGYLTQCPTNLGTGLRASVMLHLPVIENNGALEAINESASKFGLTIRGLYGEGSKSAASMYQLSNQITLGISESAALENLRSITMQIIDKEREDRKLLNPVMLEDTTMRAYGLLKNQRLLSSDELMKLLSQIKLGQSMGIINIKKTLPVELLIECQPHMLQKVNGKMSPEERDICRSRIVRERLE